MISYRWSLIDILHPVIASECGHTYTCQLSLSLRLSLSYCLSLYRDLRRRHISTDRSDKKNMEKKRMQHTYTHKHAMTYTLTGRQTDTQTISPLLHRYCCCYRYRRLPHYLVSFHFLGFFFVGNKKKIKKICFEFCFAFGFFIFLYIYTSLCIYIYLIVYIDVYLFFIKRFIYRYTIYCINVY